MKEAPYPVARTVNKIIENVGNSNPGQSILSNLIMLYDSRVAMVETPHSGYSREVASSIEQDRLSPLDALVQTSEKRLGRELSDKEKTSLYVNSAIGETLELLARGIVHIPIIGSRYTQNIKNAAQKAYDIADWDSGGTGETPQEKENRKNADDHRKGRERWLSNLREGGYLSDSEYEEALHDYDRDHGHT